MLTNLPYPRTGFDLHLFSVPLDLFSAAKRVIIDENLLSFYRLSIPHQTQDMAKPLFVAVACFFCHLCMAQQKELDSLLIVLEHTPKDDTTRLNLLNDIVFDYSLANPDKGLVMADEAIALARKLNNTPKLATAVGSSRVDLQACKLEYSIVSPK